MFALSIRWFFHSYYLPSHAALGDGGGNIVLGDINIRHQSVGFGTFRVLAQVIVQARGRLFTVIVCVIINGNAVDQRVVAVIAV